MINKVTLRPIEKYLKTQKMLGHVAVMWQMDMTSSMQCDQQCLVKKKKNKTLYIFC